MGRIKNQFKYPIDRDITDDDYVIGSDSENGGKTVNFPLWVLRKFLTEKIVQEIEQGEHILFETLPNLPCPEEQNN